MNETGSIEETWETKKLGKLSTINRGLSWSKSQENKDFKEGSAPVLRIGNVQERLNLEEILFIEQVTPEQLTKYKLTKDNIVLVGSNGNHHRIGNCCIIDKEMDFIYASFLIGIIPKKDIVDPKFLYYQISSPINQKKIFDSVTGTTGLANLSLEFIRDLNLLMPASILEQRKIALILENIDNNINQAQKIIEKYEMMKQGLIHDLFTKGIDKNGKSRTEFKDSELGKIPVSWEVKKFKELIMSMTNGFVGIATPYYTENEGVTYLYGNNVRKNSLELINPLKIKRSFHEKLKKSQLEPGDLLTVQSGHIGTTAVVPQSLGEANCHALIITKIKKDILDPFYTSFYINSEIGMTRMSEIFVGSTIKHVNVKEFKNYKIPVPPLNEQIRIKNISESIHNQIQSEKEYLFKLQKIKTGLMQDLLTGKVRVKA